MRNFAESIQAIPEPRQHLAHMPELKTTVGVRSHHSWFFPIGCLGEKGLFHFNSDHLQGPDLEIVSPVLFHNSQLEVPMAILSLSGLVCWFIVPESQKAGLAEAPSTHWGHFKLTLLPLPC